MNKKDEFQFPDYDLKSKRITVTGGKGFLGRHLIKNLPMKGAGISLRSVRRNTIS